MNWSFQLYSARNFQPWDKVLKLLGEAGYKEVEGFGGVYADPAGLRKELDKNGLSMPTGHFSIDMLENDFDGAKKIADALGMKTMICPLSQSPTRGPRRRRRLARLRRAARQGRRDARKRHGYGFAWHNHDFEFKALADGSVPQEHILDAAPDIGWEMDVAWVVRGGADPMPWIDRSRQAHRRRARQGHRQVRPQQRTRTAGPMSATARSTGRASQGAARQDAGEVLRHGTRQSERLERFAKRSIASVKSY